jgi:hypothetical protein
MTDISQYTTAEPYMGTKNSWVGTIQDQNRIAAYALYESLYDNVAKVLKLIEESGRSIYIPSGRTIVETMNRYVAPGFTITVDPAFGEEQQQLLATQVMTDFLRRERVISKFNTNKRWGIVRGDWCFVLAGTAEREPGARVSLFTVDPGSLFPIYNPLNIDEIIGWHQVDYYLDDTNTPIIQRRTWRKTTGVAGPSPITYEEGLYDPEEWGGPGMDEGKVKLLQVVVPVTPLPSPIDQLPVYHIPNRDRPGDIWGVSEMQGMENMIRALSQGASDEDLALAMEGLGVYWTDSGAPVDENGDEVPWNMGPGRVLEVQKGAQVGRVTGVSSVGSYQEHFKFIQDSMDQALGQSPASRGRIDVGVAESGIALQLNLAPTLASAAEKDTVIMDVMTNLCFDLAKWWVAYEGGAFNSLIDVTRWIPSFGPKLPLNVQQERADIMSLAAAKLIPPSYARTKLRELGYEDMPTEEEVTAELAVTAQVEQDAFGQRVDEEVNGELAQIESL